ncbi:MAG: hydrolase [Gammaproteobacteria bacterium]
MLMHPRHSLLLLIDIQERLVPAIHEHERVVENSAWLLNLARELGIPVLVSEQYPRGLGATVPEIRAGLAESERFEKVHFSCVADQGCREAIAESGRDQVVVAGIEAHVCVTQSVLQLLESGRQVFVVADAVASRSPRDAEAGLQRMRQAGAQIVTREMVFFEWLQRAGTDEFKRLSKQYVR